MDRLQSGTQDAGSGGRLRPVHPRRLRYIYHRGTWLPLAALFLLYTMTAYLSLRWAQIDGAGSPVWPAAGLEVAGLLLGGIRLWPALFLGRIAAALLSGSDLPLLADATIAAGIAGSSAMAAILFRRWRIATNLVTLISMLRFFMIGGMAKGIVSAAVGTATLSMAAGLSGDEAWRLFGLWLAGDVAGLVVVGPVILSWWRNATVPHPFYLVLIVAATAFVSWLVFLMPQIVFFRFWHVLPLLIWAALVYQVRGASLALLVMAAFATAGTSLGLVSFTEFFLPPSEHFPHLQQFLAITGLTVLLIAAIDAERKQHGEDRLRLALDATGQGIFEIDLRNGLVSGDATTRQLLGLPHGSEYVTFERLIDGAYPEHRLLVRDAIRASADPNGNGVFRVENRMYRKSGETVWVAMHGRTLFEGEGADRRALYTRGTVRDISGRKLAEEKVVASEKFTRRVLDNLFAFVGVLTPDGTLIEANHAPLEAADIQASEVIGKKFWDCYWWSYSPKVQRGLKRSIARALKGGLVRYDVQVRVAGGRLIWIDFQLAPLRDENGEITHLIPSGIDMSARMEAERASRRQVSILEATPDFIGTADVTGKVVYLNPGGRRIIGVSDRADISQFTIADLHSARAYSRIVSEAFPAASEKGVWEGESDVIGADGRAIPVSQVIVSHRDELGRVIQYSTIMRDISEQKRAQTHQAMLLRELSHRVKNTLAVIQSIARQTLRSNPDPRVFAEVFQGRIASLAASHSLLTDSEWQGASLREVIVRQLSPMLGENSTRLQAMGPRVMLPAETATQLGLVLHELGTNAVKHGSLSGSTGRIEIAWRVAGGALHFSWKERGGPPLSQPPATKGFGSNLIEMSARDVERQYAPDGFSVRFSLDLPKVRPAPATEG